MERELDFSLRLSTGARFRANAYWQRGGVAASFRLVPSRIPPLEELGLPAVVSELTQEPQGLVLVTGPTGHGKSTTLAAMIHHINQSRRAHIVTIEDPIEFEHQHDQAVVDQREVGTDTGSFAEALRRVLRQTPDVIMVGEMRDRETIGAALTAAETGHLVLATLHTNDAAQSVDRIIDVFSPGQQPQIRGQLSQCLAAVISQRLLPRVDGDGLALACEVLIATPGVRHMIRDDKLQGIATAIDAGAQRGMQSLDASLRMLVRAGRVARADAQLIARDPTRLT
jgi:twitching motility protein PilT